ncbi:hypothetical protein MNQ98_06835 [Paenibacillus sp. N3/727]|uniref:hypothetical protein n=1 Tax=Paenibacillus sp. N3/727 TaxID=2925845 RepID=UPI001F530B10|nr:hypothetical protein [Paenibacillus sp. N3/727]UNK19740.1 hypothetical protein MNQ98_06835 [Paenibacillus sp. N3/727]
MNKEESFLRILDASVVIQRNTYLILQGKAVEAEKVRQWVSTQYSDGGELKDSLSIHEQIVEQIEGLTRIGSGLCRNLRIAMGTSEDENADNMGFDAFDFGDQD